MWLHVFKFWKYNHATLAIMVAEINHRLTIIIKADNKMITLMLLETEILNNKGNEST